MKRFLLSLIAFALCLSSLTMTSCTSSDGRSGVANRTTVALISDTMTVADADRYTVTLDGKTTSQSGQAHTIVDYDGEEIKVTIHCHNVIDEYKDMFDEDESFTFAVGTAAPATDNVILVFAELSSLEDECYLSLVQRMVLTDDNGKVTIRETSNKFNLSNVGPAAVHSIYESEIK